MADYAPPTGPPPPKLPSGWKAVWNDQYKEWFYVNIYTKKSQWERPNEPVYPPGDADATAPEGAPPSYDHNTAKPTGPEKAGLTGSGHDMSEDERLARQLQEEENRRAGVGSSNDRGEADSYYQSPGAAYSQQPAVSPGGELPPRPDDTRGGKGKGLFGKLFNKKPHSPQQQYGGYQQPPQGQYYPPQQGYGPGYPPQQGYYPPQQGYGPGYPPQQPSGRRPGGGLGAGGAAALGLGGGLLGGMVLGEALHSGGDDGGYGGDDGGGDFGGGDF